MRTEELNMPMRSKAQRRFLWATKPELAKKFEKKTPEGKKLPEKVKESFELKLEEALGLEVNVV